MASNINTTDIDATYPVAGQDNDSQGFRDNFSTIKDNFVAAKAEIETLQNDTAKLNDDNNFNYSKITHAVFVANLEETLNKGSQTADSIIVNYSDGPYQTVSISPTSGNAVTISFNWPTNDLNNLGGALCKLRLIISGDGLARTVNFGANTIRSNVNLPLSVQSTTEPRVVDVWTDDGVIVYVQDHGTFA